MFTFELNDAIDMLRQLRTCMYVFHTILRQFTKYDTSIKIQFLRSFCSCYYCPYLWLDMTIQSSRN